jgi:hypothetical protein
MKGRFRGRAAERSAGCSPGGRRASMPSRWVGHWPGWVGRATTEDGGIGVGARIGPSTGVGGSVASWQVSGPAARVSGRLEQPATPVARRSAADGPKEEGVRDQLGAVVSA